jgi:hypothetical protein
VGVNGKPNDTMCCALVVYRAIKATLSPLVFLVLIAWYLATSEVQKVPVDVFMAWWLSKIREMLILCSAPS